MTQDQISTAPLEDLEARAAELTETLADPETDPNLYHASAKELEAVNTRSANLYYGQFFPEFAD